MATKGGNKAQKGSFGAPSKLISLLIGISVVFQISISLQAPVLSIYLLHLTGDLRHIGSITAVYTFGAAVFSTIASVYWIKYEFKLLFLSYASFFIYCLLMYSGPSTLEVYFIQLYGGFCTGIGWAAFLNLFVHTVKQDQYTRYYSFNKLVGITVGSFAAALSGFVAHYLGIKNVFLIMAGVTLISLGLAFILQRSYKKSHQ